MDHCMNYKSEENTLSNKTELHEHELYQRDTITYCDESNRLYQKLFLTFFKLDEYNDKEVIKCIDGFDKEMKQYIGYDEICNALLTQYPYIDAATISILLMSYDYLDLTIYYCNANRNLKTAMNKLSIEVENIDELTKKIHEAKKRILKVISNKC